MNRGLTVVLFNEGYENVTVTLFTNMLQHKLIALNEFPKTYLEEIDCGQVVASSETQHIKRIAPLAWASAETAAISTRRMLGLAGDSR